jgi:NADPH:quinone reductase-like Zn-dependent oxidoreductase
MKAITLKKNGGIENLVLTDAPKPALKPGEVLIKVKAIGINPVDAFVRQHEFALKEILQPQNGQDNFILGWDVAGTVTETAPDVTTFKQGDDVFGLVNFYGQGNAYAEYVAAPAAQLALKPANVGYKEAAAASLAALTAWQALFTYAKVKKGDKVLIHGAAGGVGHYAVQLAKHAGAYVIATGSAAKRDFIESLGADEYIDYTREKFEDRVKDADIVLDPIFGDHILRSLDAVKKGGRVISLLSYFNEQPVADKVKEKEVFAHRLSVVSSGDDAEQIATLLANGSLHSHIAAAYDFADLPKAHTQVETGKTQGKIVVTIG